MVDAYVLLHPLSSARSSAAITSLHFLPIRYLETTAHVKASNHEEKPTNNSNQATAGPLRLDLVSAVHPRSREEGGRDLNSELSGQRLKVEPTYPRTARAPSVLHDWHGTKTTNNFVLPNSATQSRSTGFFFFRRCPHLLINPSAQVDWV